MKINKQRKQFITGKVNTHLKLLPIMSSLKPLALLFFMTTGLGVMNS